MPLEKRLNFSKDPLGFIDAAVSTGASTFLLPDQTLCVANADIARSIFSNRDGLFEEHSDFFTTRHGQIADRDLQIKLGADARRLIEMRMEKLTLDPIEEFIGGKTVWPATGVLLLRNLFNGIILAPERPASLRDFVDRIVQTRICEVKKSCLPFARDIFRRRFEREVFLEYERTQLAQNGEPKDFLGVVFRYVGSELNLKQASQLYVSLLFAVIGSIGFALGWSVYLLCKYRQQHADPRAVLTEALRLYPIAWLMRRKAVRAHNLLGHKVSPNEMIVVSPYAVHRNPAYWERADQFLPDRWVGNLDRRTWMPFGSGPHACIGVRITFDLIERLLLKIKAAYAMNIEEIGRSPVVGPALRPPKFCLHAT